MNRTRRKAAKMFRRKYGKSINPYWVAQHPIAFAPEDITEAMRKAYNACVRIARGRTE